MARSHTVHFEASQDTYGSIFAKNRSGPIGDVDLAFVPASTKFYELDGIHGEG